MKRELRTRRKKSDRLVITGTANDMTVGRLSGNEKKWEDSWFVNGFSLSWTLCRDDYTLLDLCFFLSIAERISLFDLHRLIYCCVQYTQVLNLGMNARQSH